jgi:hypothetical protein
MNASPSAAPASAPELWFDLLDQRSFFDGDERLTARVAGVHVAGLDTWIQLEFEEDRRRTVLLYLAPGTGVGEAVEAVHTSLRRRHTPSD